MGSLFIIDTNVLVAGLITQDQTSPTARLVDAMLGGGILFILSPALLSEYGTVILRPRIAKLHGLSSDEVDVLLTEITGNAIWREPSEVSSSTSPDPGDTHLWDLLHSEPRAILITGDRLLLANPPDGHKLITPADYFLGA
jgi:putative PIN family toxin of toxin-antitoxin system